MEIVHSPQTWGINLTEYNKLGWGSAFARFQAPASVVKRYTRIFYTSPTDPSILEDAPFPGSIQTRKFDAARIFNELAITYINSLVASREIFRQTSFNFLEGGMVLEIKNEHGVVTQQFKAPVEGSTQDQLRKAIFTNIEYALGNKQFWENVNGSSISLPNYAIAVDSTNWMLNDSMSGMKTKNYITNSCIDDYEWVSTDTLFTNDKVGNIKIIGKASLEDIPTLAIV